MTYFRDQLIAAPLKPNDELRAAIEEAHFRDQLIAAPLKLYLGALDSWNVAAFPRSADRGPIEALR